MSSDQNNRLQATSKSEMSYEECSNQQENGGDDITAVRNHFDEKYYLQNNPDVYMANVDPFLHYINQGWLEGRNPSSNFDTNYYLKRYQDVKKSGLSPLIHYVSVGKKEGRVTRPIDSYEYQIVLKARSHSEVAKDWQWDLSNEIFVNESDLVDAIKASSLISKAGIIISFSHDDYVKNVGGVQNIVADEQKIFDSHHYCYLHICPARPLPILANAKDDKFDISVRLNGVKIGIANLNDIFKTVKIIKDSWSDVHVVVHHLLGFSPESVADFIKILHPTKSYYFIHDFFSLCPNYSLLRNDLAYCHAPKFDSTSCVICVYGDDRRAHLPRIINFLDIIDPVLVIYSQGTWDFWNKKAPTPVSAKIKSRLARLENKRLKVPRSLSQPLRVAFVGTPRHMKGWNVFTKLAKILNGDPRYEFYQFSSNHIEADNVKFKKVSVSQEDRMAMVNALSNENIDIAMIWSIWPETFCFTAYEALAAGCYVLTYVDSGNVWPAVKEHGSQGVVMSTSKQLYQSFVSGEIINVIDNRPLNKWDLHVEAPLAKHILSGPV